MIQQLNELLGAALRLDEPMRRHTSFRIGGPADAMLIPRDIGELRRGLKCARELNIPVTFMGNGSNLLVRDGGIRGLVIKLAGTLDHVCISDKTVKAGCGVLLSTLARKTADAGLKGLEFAEGIPGTVGGAVSMNAGAYDGEMKDVVVSARALSMDGEEMELDREQLAFAYRKSALQSRRLLAVEVTMELSPGDKEESLAKIADLSRRRREKQPTTLPSAGSVFKRPPGHYAGALIEQAGLKGYRIGDAQVSTLHSGFIVNVGNATARDVLDLIRHIQATVQEQSGVALETEIRIIGEELPG